MGDTLVVAAASAAEAVHDAFRSSAKISHLDSPEKMKLAEDFITPFLTRLTTLFFESLGCIEPCTVSLHVGEQSQENPAPDSGAKSKSHNFFKKALRSAGMLKSKSEESEKDQGSICPSRESSAYRYNNGIHNWVKCKLHLHGSEYGPVLDLFPSTKSSSRTAIACRDMDSVMEIDMPCPHGPVFAINYFSIELLLASSDSAQWVEDILAAKALAQDSAPWSPPPTKALSPSQDMTSPRNASTNEEHDYDLLPAEKVPPPRAKSLPAMMLPAVSGIAPPHNEDDVPKEKDAARKTSTSSESHRKASMDSSADEDDLGEHIPDKQNPVVYAKVQKRRAAPPSIAPPMRTTPSEKKPFAATDLIQNPKSPSTTKPLYENDQPTPPSCSRAASNPILAVAAAAVIASPTLTASKPHYENDSIKPQPRAPTSTLCTVAVESMSSSPDELDVSLQRFSWYHGSVSTAEASSRVQHLPSGTFLIRRSDSQRGQLVLCVNWLGTPVMLRIQVLPEERFVLCGVKFPAVDALVSFFSEHPFPSERGDKVTLTGPAPSPPSTLLSHDEADSVA